MKKLILAACFVIGATAMSFAQGGGRQMPSPADQAKQLQTALTLNDDQTAKITAIYTAQAAKLDSIRKAPGFDMSNMREVMTPIMAATKTKIKAVLTADQNTAYDKMPQRGMGGGRGPGGQGGGTPPPPPPAK